jgi:crotonobetainyl-CoA:carnitine CoA-transferase CaiB-like acyl-CoA transferase
LTGSLLSAAGGEVIKVESTHRPDGARNGNGDFFDLLNGEKQSVAVDFRSDAGRSKLRQIVDAADIVIEASRPRALRQLGINAEALVASKPGKVWLRLLAHGDNEGRIGFGDDIGVAAGLPTIMERAWGEPLMAGDAIADPLSGLHAALAALQSWQSGGGELLTVSMRDVVRNAMQFDEEIDLTKQAQAWQTLAEASTEPPYPPRRPTRTAEELGQSTQAVLDRLC